MKTYNVLVRDDSKAFTGGVGKYFGDFERAVLDIGNFDSGSQVIFRNREGLVPYWVVKDGEDGGMYFPCGMPELLRRRCDDVIGERLQFILEFRVDDLHNSASFGWYLGLALFVRWCSHPVIINP